MAGLLVSVRDAAEAVAAAAGGASVVDVKEPRRGPLGRADVAVWAAVGEAIGSERPVSVALGEVTDPGLDTLAVPRELWRSLSFVKLGLAGGAGISWQERWADLVERLGPGPGWVGVVYLDADCAGAPAADEVISAAVALGCVGVLFDTWDKGRPAPGPETGWGDLLARVATGWQGWRGFRAVAGGLDALRIEQLRRGGIEPELFAVRGSACLGGERGGRIDHQRVASLVQAAAMRLV